MINGDRGDLPLRASSVGSAPGPGIGFSHHNTTQQQRPLRRLQVKADHVPELGLATMNSCRVRDRNSLWERYDGTEFSPLTPALSPLRGEGEGCGAPAGRMGQEFSTTSGVLSLLHH